MKRVLVAVAMSAMALAASSAVANADPDPFSPPSPGVVDLITTESPGLLVDPSDEGGPSMAWGGTGMYCQNLYVKCR
ncbi:hypothetical protein A5787_05760 [Mycobacterium sp. 852002-50816_SCH5313054-b]|uniref:hypothetical protein n=1 Tax=Mycobacterium sp. 852002-50816_SCH5313054-b TaxID=1834092 RepID=UPI0008003D43|nr:hypothetical protein [Mycobacterium sp. 852002-50816_SCH5313054-b]OBF53620.1 hypothetical protein A5787_05760 [Mycobacterium sp. 852002-50816_SCH5313054-b]